MLSTLGTKFNIQHFEIFFLSFPENKNLFFFLGGGGGGGGAGGEISSICHRLWNKPREVKMH